MSSGSSNPSGPAVHQVVFVAYPKLLFIWPLIVLGFAFWPLGHPGATETPSPAAETAAAQPGEVGDAEATLGAEAGEAPPTAARSRRLEVLGWIYLWVAAIVLLTLGVDIDRNKAVFWVILVAAVYVLGLWLHDVKGFTLFGEIYRWFAGLDLQYDRGFGLALSIILLVPYAVMLLWARLNDRWRITHNEFEHYAFGKMNDSLGRGAKTIRTEFPDVFELLLGLAGTLIVYNATGTRELRRIPHIMFLPMIRRRLDKILETTSVTAAQMEEEEEDEDV